MNKTVGIEATMESSSLLKLKEWHLRGRLPGVFAVCSAHPVVLATAMELAGKSNQSLLVEATANQVNQYGGYTGMTPEDYVGYLYRLAHDKRLPARRLLIGADHLGPHLWGGVSSEEAMRRTENLVRLCVSAGYSKIHLDTGAPCASDPGPPLPVELSAERAALLCAAAEDEAGPAGSQHRPLYVIGNETPLPGGDLQEGASVKTTSSRQLEESLGAFQRAFARKGLAEAWMRVLAVVVQPGIDFGDRRVADYQPVAAADLSAAHERLPGAMTYEVHSTDYQRPEALEQLVNDHFILLKVGPCLTFAMRKALYALAEIEAALPAVTEPTRLPEVMERLMVNHPVHWQGRLRGDEAELRYLRHHSLRDRIRYYWSFPEARDTVKRLLRNLRRPIPQSLLKEHLPELYGDIEEKRLHDRPEAIVRLAVAKALEPYLHACRATRTN